jgi:hypothetical protein
LSLVRMGDDLTSVPAIKANKSRCKGLPNGALGNGK